MGSTRDQGEWPQSRGACPQRRGAAPVCRGRRGGPSLPRGCLGPMLFPQFSCQHPAQTGLWRTRARRCHTVSQPLPRAAVMGPVLHTQAPSGGFQLRPAPPCSPHLLLAPSRSSFPQQHLKLSFSPRTLLAAQFDHRGNIWLHTWPSHTHRHLRAVSWAPRWPQKEEGWLSHHGTSTAKPLCHSGWERAGQSTGVWISLQAPWVHAPHSDSWVGVHCGPRTRWELP